MATFGTAIASVFKALRAALVRPGVNVGGTASYPRVEIHSAVENAPEAKDGGVRSVTCTIESVSDTKLANVVDMVAENAARIFDAAGLDMQEYSVIGIVPGQTRMLEEQEVTDQNKVLYRILQDVTIWVDKKQS